MVIQTPCKGICKMHPTYKICIGCLRTRMEIAKWHNSTDEQKQAIIISIEIKRKIYGDLSG